MADNGADRGTLTCGKCGTVTEVPTPVFVPPGHMVACPVCWPYTTNVLYRATPSNSRSTPQDVPGDENGR